MPVNHELRASQDRGLRGRAADVARLSASAPALLTTPGALNAPYGGQDLLVEVLDRHRRIVARSSALGGRLVPADALVARAIAGEHAGFGHAQLSGEQLRLFVAPLPGGHGPAAGGAVVAASSTTEIERTSERVRSLILLFAIVAMALGAAIAAVLTGRALTPLRRLTDGARSIARTRDTTQRLPAADVPEVRELTETLNTMLAALEAAGASERRFLADASHELRTPVTALRGNAEYLARHGADPDALADLLADADRLARLVDDLLVLERQATPAAAADAVDLAALVREVTARAGPDVAVEHADSATTTGDPAALRRALENLLANARVHGAPPVRVSLRRSGERAQLTVRDGGPGIAAADAQAAFGRFWRAGGRPGSGLGLAIARATARAHGGDVSVSGSAVTIDLPIVRESSSSAGTVNDVASTTEEPS